MPPVNRRPAPSAARAPAPARRGPAPAARAPARGAAPARGSSGYRGDAGYAMMQQEEANAEARKEAQASQSGMPFRFFCGVGETREVVVVDEKPDFFRYEHNLPDRDGRWKIFTSCINEYANCPICHSGGSKYPYFAMYLTVIDLTPYTNKDGIEVPWSKKLLVVKPAQQKKIMRKLEQNDNNLRGAVLSMSRDGDKDASIGNDIELVEFMSEDELLTYETSYVNQKNEQIDVIGHEPFDYDELFPEQSEEQLAALAGGNHNSYDDHARNVGASGGRRGAPARPGAAPRGRSGDGWDEGAERRPAARGAAPARRPAARQEEQPEEELEEEAPPPARRAAPASRQAPAPAGRAAGRPAPRQVSRQAAEPEYEDEVPEEDPPQRPAARGAARPAARPADAAPPSLASRRAALRGNGGRG